MEDTQNQKPEASSVNAQYSSVPVYHSNDDNRPKITPENLNDFIKFIVTNIVTNKDKVEVTVMEDFPGSYTVHIKVAPEDRGRVIGKKGNTINALRSIVKVFGKHIVLLQE